MPDVEKVIKGLGEALTLLAEYVPCEGYLGYAPGACLDAIDLLKAQEPRVMDFDDVVGGDECWLEAINGACGYADCYACTGAGEVQVFQCKHDNPQYIMARDYLKTWRCWTSRPDEKRRAETPWN